MQELRRPRNTVLQLSELPPTLKLEEGRASSFRLCERSETQSVHLLQLRKDAVLNERYHRHHDLTLLCVAGSAIVQVEGERDFVQSPAAVFIPRLRAYKIIPHETETEFAALMVYSPPFDGEDLVLTEK